MAERNLYWSTLIYPDENPHDWRAKLGDMHIKVAISPRHDLDVYENDGEGHKKGDFKKPHHHLVFVFGSLKSRKQVQKITDEIGAVGQESVMSIKNMLRYLTHADNPDKAQYSDPVETLGGLNMDDYLLEGEERINGEIGKIFKVIYENRLREFCELCDYIGQEQPELFTTLRKNAYFFTQYIKSKQQIYEKNVESAEINLANESTIC